MDYYEAIFVLLFTIAIIVYLYRLKQMDDAPDENIEADHGQDSNVTPGYKMAQNQTLTNVGGKDSSNQSVTIDSQSTQSF